MHIPLVLSRPGLVTGSHSKVVKEEKLEPNIYTRNLQIGSSPFRELSVGLKTDEQKLTLCPSTEIA